MQGALSSGKVSVISSISRVVIGLDSACSCSAVRLCRPTEERKSDITPFRKLGDRRIIVQIIEVLIVSSKCISNVLGIFCSSLGDRMDHFGNLCLIVSALKFISEQLSRVFVKVTVVRFNKYIFFIVFHEQSITQFQEICKES